MFCLSLDTRLYFCNNGQTTTTFSREHERARSFLFLRYSKRLEGKEREGGTKANARARARQTQGKREDGDFFIFNLRRCNAFHFKIKNEDAKASDCQRSATCAQAFLGLAERRGKEPQPHRPTKPQSKGARRDREPKLRSCLLPADEAGHLALPDVVESDNPDPVSWVLVLAVLDLGENLISGLASEHGELPHGPVPVLVESRAGEEELVGVGLLLAGELDAWSPSVADEVVDLPGDLLVGERGEVGKALVPLLRLEDLL